jgi:hypothetical protein
MEESDGPETGSLGADRDVVSAAGVDRGSGHDPADPRGEPQDALRTGELPDRPHDPPRRSPHRTSHSDVATTFARFVNALGRPDLELDLEYYGAAGGYRIVTRDQRTPFGSRRRTRREMVMLLDFAIDALFLAKKGR